MAAGPPLLRRRSPGAAPRTRRSTSTPSDRDAARARRRRLLATAGDRARRRMESRSAVDYYERALAMAGAEDGWGVREARVLAGMGESRYWLGEYPAAGEALERAVTLGTAHRTTGRSRSPCGSWATSPSTSRPTSTRRRSCSTGRWTRPRPSATRSRSAGRCCSPAGCPGPVSATRTPRRSGGARSRWPRARRPLGPRCGR